MQKMESEILEMLEELKPGEDYSGSNSFVDDGLLDSFDIISLVSMLEEKYDIAVDGLDIIPAYFQNIEAIINLVKKSRKPKGKD